MIARTIMRFSVAGVSALSVWESYRQVAESGHGLRLAVIVFGAALGGAVAGSKAAIWALKGLLANRPIVSEESKS